MTLFLLVLILLVLGWRGYDYYPLSLDDRVEHPDYRTLRSSGDIGYGYGIAGTILIFTNLLYLARRRFAKWNIGSIKTWLDLHVITGLTGALFISFHSTFKARNTIAQVTSWSLLMVVITGLIGRFLYALVPRKDEKGFRAALAELEAISPPLKEGVANGLAEISLPKGGKIPLWRLPGYLGNLSKIHSRQRELIRLEIENHELFAAQSSELSDISRRLQRATGKSIRSLKAGAFLRSWRALHLFFAILMLLTVVFHIGIAWYYGYRWIWSE